MSLSVRDYNNKHDSQPQSLVMSTQDACTSLVEALDARRTDIVKSLLDHLTKSDPSGASLRAVLDSNCTRHGTILHYAVQAKLCDAIRAIMRTADPGVRNEANQTVIELAADSPEVLQLFSDELFRAVAASELGRVSQLLSSGVSKDAVDSGLTRNTALHWAASFGSEDVIQLLIDNQFDVNAQNSDGCTPLHDAVQRKDQNIIKLLIAAGADTSISPIKGKLRGKTPRELAALSDHLCALFPVENGVEKTSSTEKESEECEAPCEKSPARPSYQRRSFECEELELLWPPPRHLQELPGARLQLPPHLQLVVRPGAGHSLHELVDVWEVYRADINTAGHSLGIRSVETGCEVSSCPGDLEVSLSPSLAAEEYSLTVSQARVRLRAGAVAGLHYGCQTFLQMLVLFRGGSLPQLVIRDRPSLAVRGVLLDLALYGRLPTLETLTSTVRALARLKLTELHLFIRLTASEGNDWQLPYQSQDLISLDRECHDRRVKLYPVLDILQPCQLAELRQYTAAFSLLSSCLSSRDKLHLGPCLSSVIISAAAKTGPSLVFPALPGLLAVSPHTNLVLCANSLASHPAVLPSLPASVSLMEYGFQADYPCHHRLGSLSVSGCDLLLCAGTSAWNCLVGRPANMTDNLLAGVEALSQTSSTGLVVASWAGSPALAPVSSSLPGWALGAGLAWNSHTEPSHVSKYLGPVVSRHLLSDQLGTSGQVVLDLARLEETVQLPGLPGGNGLQSSLLLTAIMRPNSLDLDNTSAASLGTVIQEARKCLARLQQSREGGGGPGEGLLQEITLSGELLLLAARLARGLILTEDRTVASLQPTFKTDLANKLLSLTEQYRAVWLSRYQPSGMQSSLLHLTALLNILLPTR